MTGRGGLDPVVLAALDNARWCDAVCRAHGLRTGRTARLWTCHGTPPPFHPVAATLARGPDVEAELRAFLGASPPAAGGVKDGFLEIDLADLGFAELFRASWLWSPPAVAGPTSLRWRRATTAPGLAAWEAAWAGSEQAPAASPRFPTTLLADDGLVFLAGWRGERIAVVAALSRTDPVVGISNVTGSDPASDDGWADLPAVAASWFPGRPLVGYERGTDLERACRHGFSEIGPLRVWVPDAS